MNKYIPEYFTPALVALCLARALLDPTLATAALFLISVIPFIYGQWQVSFTSEKANDLQNQIQMIQAQLNEFKRTQAQVAKSAEDIQKVIQTKTMSQGIYSRAQRI